jgi:hypothetical protein
MPRLVDDVRDLLSEAESAIRSGQLRETPELRQALGVLRQTAFGPAVWAGPGTVTAKRMSERFDPSLVSPRTPEDQQRIEEYKAKYFSGIPRYDWLHGYQKPPKPAQVLDEILALPTWAAKEKRLLELRKAGWSPIGVTALAQEAFKYHSGPALISAEAAEQGVAPASGETPLAAYYKRVSGNEGIHGVRVAAARERIKQNVQQNTEPYWSGGLLGPLHHSVDYIDRMGLALGRSLWSGQDDRPLAEKEALYEGNPDTATFANRLLPMAGFANVMPNTFQELSRNGVPGAVVQFGLQMASPSNVLLSLPAIAGIAGRAVLAANVARGGRLAALMPTTLWETPASSGLSLAEWALRSPGQYVGRRMAETLAANLGKAGAATRGLRWLLNPTTVTAAQRVARTFDVALSGAFGTDMAVGAYESAKRFAEGREARDGVSAVLSGIFAGLAGLHVRGAKGHILAPTEATKERLVNATLLTRYHDEAMKIAEPRIAMLDPTLPPDARLAAEKDIIQKAYEEAAGGPRALLMQRDFADALLNGMKPEDAKLLMRVVGEANVQDILKRMGKGWDWTLDSSMNLILTHKQTGAVLEIATADKLEPTQTDLQRYPQLAGGDFVIRGRWTKGGKSGTLTRAGLIELSASDGVSSTFDHELLHAAMELVLTEEQKMALARRYGVTVDRKTHPMEWEDAVADALAAELAKPKAPIAKRVREWANAVRGYMTDRQAFSDALALHRETQPIVDALRTGAVWDAYPETANLVASGKQRQAEIDAAKQAAATPDAATPPGATPPAATPGAATPAAQVASPVPNSVHPPEVLNAILAAVRSARGATMDDIARAVADSGVAGANAVSVPQAVEELVSAGLIRLDGPSNLFVEAGPSSVATVPAPHVRGGQRAETYVQVEVAPTRQSAVDALGPDDAGSAPSVLVRAAKDANGKPPGRGPKDKVWSVLIPDGGTGTLVKSGLTYADAVEAAKQEYHRLANEVVDEINRKRGHATQKPSADQEVGVTGSTGQGDQGTVPGSDQGNTQAGSDRGTPGEGEPGPTRVSSASGQPGPQAGVSEPVSQEAIVGSGEGKLSAGKKGQQTPYLAQQLQRLSEQGYVGQLPIDPALAAKLGPKKRSQQSQAMQTPNVYVRSINLERAGVPGTLLPDVHRLIHETASALPDQPVVPHESEHYAAAQAVALGIDVERVARMFNIDPKTGTSKDGVDIPVAIDLVRNMLAFRGQELHEAMEAYRTASPAEKLAKQVDVAEARAKFEAVLATVSGAANQLGRAMNLMKVIHTAKYEGLGIGSAMGQKVARKLSRMLGEDLPPEVIQEISDAGNDVIELGRIARKYRKSSFGDWLVAYRYNNLLSGPPTFTLNLMSTLAGGVLLRPAERALMVAIDPLIRVLPGFRRPDGVRVEPQEVAQFLRATPGGVIRGFQAFMETLRYGFTEADAANMEWGHYELPGGLATNAPSRLMSATDRFLWTITYHQALVSESYREAARVARERRLSRMEQLQLQMDYVSGASKKVMDEASRVADEAVYHPPSDDSAYTDMLYKLGQLRHSVPGFGKPLHWAMPFANTVIELMRQGVFDYTGLSAIHHMAKRDLRQSPRMTEKVAKAMVGGVVFLTASALYDQGIITGPAPKDDAARDQFYRMGKIPWAIRLNDKYVPLSNLGPLAMPFYMIAGYRGIMEDRSGLQRPEKKSVYAAMGALGNAVMQSSPLMGLNDLLVTLTEPTDRKVQKQIANLVSQVTPASGLMRQFVAAFDRYQRDPSTWQEYWRDMVPYLSATVPAKVNVYGETVTRNPGGHARLLVRYSSRTTDPRTLFLERQGVFPTLAEKSVDIGKLGAFPLSAEQTRELQRRQGAFTNRVLSRMMPREELLNRAPEKPKEDFMREWFGKARSAGTKSYLRDFIRQQGIR